MRKFRILLMVALMALATVTFADGKQGKPFEELQEQINELHARIDNLDGAGAHQGVYLAEVDCDAGETITDALDGAPSGALDIWLEVSGVCQENVIANRARIRLIGVTPDAGIDGGTNGPALWNNAHERMYVLFMSVSSDSGSAIRCLSGSMLAGFTAVQGNELGVSLENGCDARIFGGSIQGGVSGLRVSGGSAANVVGTQIFDSAVGLLVENNASALLLGGFGGPATFDNNTTGILVEGNSSLVLSNASINNSAAEAVVLSLGSFLRVEHDAYVSIDGYGSFGLGLFHNSTAIFPGSFGFDISAGGGDAISCDDSIRTAGNLSLTGNIQGPINADCPGSL